MKLRCYQPADCAEMSRLFYETVHTVNAADYPPEQLAVWATGEVDLEAWNRSFLAHHTLVAEEKGRIIGFGDMDETGYLDRLYVHKDHQRQAVATAICDALEGKSGAWGFTTHASITARPFFEKRGYTVVRKQQVERQGILLTNYVMKKQSVKRIMVIGCPGSGKSTFSRTLREKTGLPLYHLDNLYWNADRTTVSGEIFRQRLHEVLAKRAWILDGNYGSTMELRMQRCDAVIFLDYAVEVCLAGALARIGSPRSDIPWIETEADPEFLDFIRDYPVSGRPKVLELMERYSDKKTLVLETREEAERWLSEL